MTGAKIANNQVVRSINSLADNVTIKAGENVAITPNGDTLTISATGSGTDGDWIVSGDDIYAAVSGNVGIGTTVPGSTLHVTRDDKTISAAVFANTNALGGSSGLEIRSASNYAYLDFAAGSTDDDDGGTPDGTARIWNQMVGGSSKLYFGLNAPILTRPDQPKMTIQADGNIGIGTTSPTAKLHIDGTPGVDGIKFPDGTLQTTAMTVGGDGHSLDAADGDPANVIFVSNEGNVGLGTVNPMRTFHMYNSDHVTMVLEDAGASANQKKKFINSDNGYLRFGKFSDSWAFESQMEIDNSGNLGIGASASTEKLKVNGMIHSMTGGFKFPDGTIQTTAGGGGGLVLPYSGSAEDSSTLFSLTQTGTGGGMRVSIESFSESSRALEVISSGRGITFYAENTGGTTHGEGGPAGKFKVVVPNTSPALIVEAFSEGGAIVAHSNDFGPALKATCSALYSPDVIGSHSGSYAGVEAKNTGDGPALRAEHTGESGNIAEFVDDGTMRVTIAKDGDVGIGTADPQAKLGVDASQNCVNVFPTSSPNWFNLE